MRMTTQMINIHEEYDPEGKTASNKRDEKKLQIQSYWNENQGIC